MRPSLSLIALTLCAAPALLAESLFGLPLHIQKPAPNTLRLWVGDKGRSSAVVAFATQQGLVVVDTLGLPAMDRELRKVIAREFGRKDFKVLINTHEHLDHTGGNSAYADCTIVAHTLCGEGMKATAKHLPRWKEMTKQQVSTLEAELAKLPKGDAKIPGLKEECRFSQLQLQAYEESSQPTLPTRTFRDRLSLPMGDTTFELFYTGGIHSPSDIAIHVPERRLLITGDVMADAWLNEAPGCLSSFMIRSGLPQDFPLLFQNWDALRARKDQIQTLLPGHWNATLSWKGFEQRCAYVRALWEGVQASVKADKPMESIFQDLPLKVRFPELLNCPGVTPQTHNMSLVGLYSHVTGATSAAERIQELASTPGSEDGIRQVLANRGKKPAKYYFLENEFHFRGYQRLQENQTAQAVTLFHAWVDAFPQSWNAHDSLAEACLKAGDRTGAKTHYERSVALNPKNTNGVEALAKLGAAQ